MIDKGFNFKNSYIDLPNVFYALVSPSKVPDPKLVILNNKLIEDLGLKLGELQCEDGLEILSGNKAPKGAVTLAQAYAGHQFGNFTMLGDGRAILLGEHITAEGNRFDIQLKGSGRTPYSRGGDGKASLGPMIREYIISEAMNGLGIPTVRSLSVVTTGEEVYRETRLPGAVLTRVASSHIRVGTFQYARGLNDIQDLKALADYTLERHYKDGIKEENPYVYLLKEVIKKQATLISKWQLVGFIHGVMNTDNMTISGETIDYGPCAFMDTYDPETVFSSIDKYGRYSYENQPSMAEWDLARFAETLLPLLHDDMNEAIKIAQGAVSEFHNLYTKQWLSGMRKKLGLFNEEEEDTKLIEGILTIMKKYSADYTNTFRALTINKYEDTEIIDKEDFNQWINLWKERLLRQDEKEEAVLNLMRNNNPAVIPRNHRVEEALDYAVNKGDYSVLEKLLEVLSEPYSYSAEQEEYRSVKTKVNYRTFCGT
ncbi:YdiU family protein [Clostridium gasigenes]|uniref:protein adenylyltransferase SelO n=1 Tax=Clostridium gasigenes TaxID=94869 RepID=UPI001C0D3651|nr:YdiU family protein [Clostridium gasigenes]MBU3136772.1 YdiU family protein [Clostridium gasigenes]